MPLYLPKIASTRVKLTIRICLFIAFVATLTMACEYSETDNRVRNVTTTSTPRLLRSIPIIDLTAKVTIDGTTSTYSGRDFSDGNWVITVEVEREREYVIVIEWLVSNVLVMEEKGRFSVGATATTIKPELDFITEEKGTSRFDNDCNEKSNLDEILEGIDPAEIVASENRECPTNPVIPETSELFSPSVSQQYRSFANAGLIQPLTRFSILVQIRRINVNRASAHHISFYSNGFTQENEFIEDDSTAGIIISYDPDVGKNARFFISENIYSLTASSAENNCVVTMPNGARCETPYDWKVLDWYELVLEQISKGIWQGAVIDQESGQVTQIGTLETPVDINWFGYSVLNQYEEQFSGLECTNGIAPITMHFKSGLANNSFIPKKISTKNGKCVELGAGFSSGVRSENGEDIYSLTLGKRQ